MDPCEIQFSFAARIVLGSLSASRAFSLFMPVME
jgi:hypothetical protein